MVAAVGGAQFTVTASSLHETDEAVAKAACALMAALSASSGAQSARRAAQVRAARSN
jgi:hypothetical protein